jgi:hypothetical protein
LGYEFSIVKEQPWTFVADTILQCRPYWFFLILKNYLLKQLRIIY